MADNNSGACAAKRPWQKTTPSIYEKFLIEKDAKNKAYAFILTSGLLAKFKKFRDSIPQGTDPHALCLAILASRYTE